MGAPGIDFPEQRSVVDVLVSGRGEVLVSWVQSADDREIVVTVGEDRDRRRAVLAVGERLELVWRAPGELRSLPVELTAVDLGTAPTWRLRPAGPATRGQRRAAVRAPMRLPALLTADSVEAAGTTVDVSEAGARVVFGPLAGDGVPEAGAVVMLRLSFADEEVVCQAEVIRRVRRSDRVPELTFRFIGLHENTENVIRRHVFAELRSLRARGLA